MLKRREKQQEEITKTEAGMVEKVNPLIFFEEGTVPDLGLCFKTEDNVTKVSNITTVYDNLINDMIKESRHFLNKEGKEYSLYKSNPSLFADYNDIKTENVHNFILMSLSKQVIDMVCSVIGDNLCQILYGLTDEVISPHKLIRFELLDDTIYNYIHMNEIKTVSDSLTKVDALNYLENVKGMIIAMIASGLYDNSRELIYSKSIEQYQNCLDNIDGLDEKDINVMKNLTLDDVWYSVQNCIYDDCIKIKDLLDIILEKQLFDILKYSNTINCIKQIEK